MRLLSLLLSIKAHGSHHGVLSPLRRAEDEIEITAVNQKRKREISRLSFILAFDFSIKITIKLAKFEFEKCFIYEMFDDVCCDSEWNDETVYLFAARFVLEMSGRRH